MISSIADGRPSEIEYIYHNWTHIQIAREYGIKVYRESARPEDTRDSR